MELVLFIGPPAAGKSTFYASRFAQTHLRLSLDMLRTRHREALLLTACLAAKQPIVIDNTCPTRAERARYIALARAERFRVVGYRFEAPFDELLRRNAGRAGRACVPEVAIRATLARLERPDWAEGFDALFHVRPAADDPGGFSVEAIAPPPPPTRPPMECPDAIRGA
jgi:predicted kinase